MENIKEMVKEDIKKHLDNCQIHFESTKLTNRQLSIILNEICAELKRRMLN